MPMKNPIQADKQSTHPPGRAGTLSGETSGNTLTELEQKKLVHDLQVHQIELQTQNEELRKAQEQLGEMVEKYSDLYDFSPVGYVTSKKNGLILELNLTFAGQLGRERTSLLETPLWLYATAGDRNKLQSHIEQVFATGKQQTCELCLTKKNSREIFVQLDSIRVVHGDGSHVCRTSATDISLRKDVEKELLKIHDELERRVQERTAELWVNERRFKRLSQEFQGLLNAITDTLILFSPKMKVLWTNSEDAVHLRDNESEAVGQFCYALIHDRQSLNLDCPITRCFATGELALAIATHNGAILDLRAFPIKDGATINSVLLLVSDITEKIAVQAEAMQAAHMASLGELASGVAHEINNPITGIINYGQILSNECPPGSLEKDIGERIVKEGDRIGRIVKTLLSYARDGREEKQPIEVHTILEESIILTQAQIRKEGIDLRIDLADDLPEIHANLQQIQQSFINIINNARYALNEKYTERHDNKYLAITGTQVVLDGTPYVRLVFHDTGVGISATDLPRLTKQFFSTKPIGKGTGLGLSITAKIIADHGGHLDFASKEGVCTTVTMDLPVADSTKRGNK
jgi:two-component system, NtrC family, sensor kinase